MCKIQTNQDRPSKTDNKVSKPPSIFVAGIANIIPFTTLLENC